MDLLLLLGDIYVHADLHGATSCVIKNPSGRPALSELPFKKILPDWLKLCLMISLAI
jgi:hypothetical protein